MPICCAQSQVREPPPAHTDDSTASTTDDVIDSSAQSTDAALEPNATTPISAHGMDSDRNVPSDGPVAFSSPSSSNLEAKSSYGPNSPTPDSPMLDLPTAQADSQSAASLTQDIDVLFISNSQFRSLDLNRLNCGKNHVHVLADKTTKGAIYFLESYKPATAPKVIALQVISNSLEASLDPDAIMKDIVSMVSIINRSCPSTYIAICVPLPCLCSTPDITRWFDLLRDTVEERLDGLAKKGHNVSIVGCDEIASYSRALFRGNKHLSHSSQVGSGGSTGLGLLVRAYKAVIIPYLKPARTSHTQGKRDFGEHQGGMHAPPSRDQYRRPPGHTPHPCTHGAVAIKINDKIDQDNAAIGPAHPTALGVGSMTILTLNIRIHPIIGTEKMKTTRTNSVLPHGAPIVIVDGSSATVAHNAFNHTNYESI